MQTFKDLKRRLVLSCGIDLLGKFYGGQELRVSPLGGRGFLDLPSRSSRFYGCTLMKNHLPITVSKLPDGTSQCVVFPLSRTVPSHKPVGSENGIRSQPSHSEIYNGPLNRMNFAFLS